MCTSVRQHDTFEGTEDARVPGMIGEGESDLGERFLNSASTCSCVGYVEDLGHEQICFFKITALIWCQQMGVEKRKKM